MKSNQIDYTNLSASAGTGFVTPSTAATAQQATVTSSNNGFFAQPQPAPYKSSTSYWSGTSRRRGRHGGIGGGS